MAKRSGEAGEELELWWLPAQWTVVLHCQGGDRESKEQSLRDMFKSNETKKVEFCEERRRYRLGIRGKMSAGGRGDHVKESPLVQGKKKKALGIHRDLQEVAIRPKRVSQ